MDLSYINKLVLNTKLRRRIPMALPASAAILCPNLYVTQRIAQHVLFPYKAVIFLNNVDPYCMQGTMESVGSNSPSLDAAPSAAAAAMASRSDTLQHIADRIIRALRHRLQLLHRSGADFFILGATGNVYKVTLSAAPSCSCPDRIAPCKHILFVLLRVLGLSLGDACVWRRTLRPCQIAHLLNAPMASDVMASARARERFHELSSCSNSSNHCSNSKDDKVEDDHATCPVCLDEMAGGVAGTVKCSTCGNRLHAECMARWKRSRGRRWVSCVVCRARWRPRKEQEVQYVNLAAYVGEDAEMEDVGSSCGS